ncbi:MAG: hypothetical protein RMK18_08480 [Armatimonadota bacterium]|nr:hypothetical protein [Armatimonadota bacterium]MCX7777632.1 hypothetical protein [Armatimonadota bacterium]MDW8025878.1 hypothetical protein [Armatimonadota bacterium]
MLLALNWCCRNLKFNLVFSATALLFGFWSSQGMSQQDRYADVIIAPFTFDFDASPWNEGLTKLVEDELSLAGLSLISHEQVEQELALMRATPPLSRGQLAELSKRLRVGACVDVIGSLQSVSSSKWRLIVCARWLDADFCLFTRGGVSRCYVEDAKGFTSSVEPPDVLKKAVKEAIAMMLRSQPVRSQVQLQLPSGAVHIMGGKRAGWKRGMEVAICRRTYNRELRKVEWQVVGFAQITAVETLHAVARPIKERFSTRNPDEAISLFIVPKELSHLVK